MFNNLDKKSIKTVSRIGRYVPYCGKWAITTLKGYEDDKATEAIGQIGRSSKSEKVITYALNILEDRQSSSATTAIGLIGLVARPSEKFMASHIRDHALTLLRSREEKNIDPNYSAAAYYAGAIGLKHHNMADSALRVLKAIKEANAIEVIAAIGIHIPNMAYKAMELLGERKEDRASEAIAAIGVSVKDTVVHALSFLSTRKDATARICEIECVGFIRDSLEQTIRMSMLAHQHRQDEAQEALGQSLKSLFVILANQPIMQGLHADDVRKAFIGAAQFANKNSSQTLPSSEKDAADIIARHLERK